MTMTADVDVVTPGSGINYTLTVSNNGPDNATGIEVTNYLAAGLIENMADINMGGVYSDNQIIWMIPELLNGESVDLIFGASVISNIGREDIVNSAEITMSDQFDPNSTPDNMGATPSENDEAIHIVSVNMTADLELDIMNDDNLYGIGETVTIEIKLSNKGLDNAAMVTVVNYVPSGMTNVTNISNGGTLVDNEIQWSIFDLDMNEELILTFDTELIAVISECDAYLNKAEVLQSSSEDSDSSPGNALNVSEDDDDEVNIGILQVSCVDVEIKVILEGAYMINEGLMHNSLYQNGYLPGQLPQTFFGKREDPGQPYYNIPWEHCGEEGDSFDANNEGLDDLAGYPENAVDWVLVSLRSEKEPKTAVCRKAALVLDNGEVFFVEEFDCCGIDDEIEYFVVIEHRNHLPIMSPTKVEVTNGIVTYDFTAADSYVALLGTGQKELVPGLFVMIAGNGEQSDFIESGDINVNDLSKWSQEEGDNSGYYFNDFDLNGDVNVQDKSIVLRNFGVFTDVISK